MVSQEDVKERAVPASIGWDVLTLESADRLQRAHVEALVDGRIPAIRVPAFVPAPGCEAVVANLRRLGLGTYEGMKKALGTVWPNHWVARYVTGDWDAYFTGVPGAEQEKLRVFEPIGDPRRLVNAVLGGALGTEITPLRCPWTDRPFHATIVRTGRAELHYDWARFDLMAGLAERVTAQLAWNIYLANPGRGGELEVFRRLGSTVGLSKADAAARGPSTVFGNYGFPGSEVLGAERVAVPARQGDLLMIMNRHYHRVAPIEPNHLDAERVAISAHVICLDDGAMHDFS